MSVYCSQNHENPPGSRFCRLCGEVLVTNNGGAGEILGDRYQILREIGHGGFGRTYLAEDIHRFREACVLKEFAPQVQGSQALQKAESLFEREAGVLYQLQHPQIPRFRESFRAELYGQKRLFLVQDYIEGLTYQALLSDRRLQGRCFSEAEVTQILIQVLPVLDYIHHAGVIHRDIAPDNLIQRASDGLPVLIDFGGVKQIAATVASQFAPGNAYTATRLGKVGYAPPEQMQQGIVSPSSDLYALAVTMLVLLTGKEPQMLVDLRTLEWTWRREVQLSYSLGTILDRMLAARPGDRFPSATAVLQALNGTDPGAVAPLYLQVAPPTVTPTSATIPLAPIAPAPSSTEVLVPDPPPKRPRPWWGCLPWLVLMILAGLLGWWGTLYWLGNPNPPADPSPTPVSPSPTPDPEPDPSSQYSPEEQARKEALRERRQALGVDFNWYVRLVNQSFYERYPDRRDRPLNAAPEDEALRAEWDAIAADWLDWLADNLDAQARRNLGRYTDADLQRWKAAVNARYLSSRALYDLTDAAFFQLLPEQEGAQFLQQPVGQIWRAIAAQQVAAIEGGQALEKLQFDPGAVNGYAQDTLQPGEGKAYIANLRQGQLMRLTLEAPETGLLLSVYTPTSKTAPLLEDSRDRTWSGSLPESGYYEFVVVGTGPEPVDYQLNLIVEDAVPTLEPTPPPEPREKNS